MQKCFKIWKRGDIDRKINRRKMIQWAEELCKIKPVIQEVEVKTEPKIIREEPKKVFGVIPEEKKSWLKFLFPWKKDGESNDSTRPG